MADRESEILLRYKVDRASQAATVKSARDIRSSLQDIGRVREIDKAAKSFRTYQREVDQARASVDRLSTAQDRFDATSRKVALAGDFQSNLGAVRGLSDLAGLGGVGQGIGAAGEIAVLAEELPRLKEAAAGLPSTIGAAASALGPVGLGLGAVALLATGAVVGVTNAMKRLDEEAQKAADNIVAAAIETGRAGADIDQLLLRGDTEGAFQVLEGQFTDYTTFLLQQADLRKRITQAEIERERARSEAGTFLGAQVFTDATREADKVLEGLNTEMESLQASGFTTLSVLEEMGRKLGLTDVELGTVAAALDANIPKTKELAQSEDELTRARQAQFTGLQQQANEEVRRLQFQEQARSVEAKANQERLKQIGQQTQQIQAQIDVYEEFAATNEFASKEVARLTNELSLLGEESQFIGTVLPQQRAKERAAAAKEENQSVLEEEKALAAERAAVAENLRNELQAIALDTARRQLEAFEKLQESVAQLEGDLARDLANAGEQARRDTVQAQLDFQRQQVEADIQHYRTLEDLRRKFERDEQDAALDRDFRRLFELRQQRQREFEDAARARQEQLTDDQRAFDQQAADRAAALQQERQDLIAAAVIRRMELQADYQKQLQVIRENQARQLVELSEKYGIELQLRQSGHNQEAQLLQSAIQAELALRQQGYQAELLLLSQFVSSVSLLMPRSIGSTSSTTTNPTPITKTSQTGGTGANTPSVPTTPVGGGGGGAKNINIHINGNNEDRILKVVNRGLTE